MQDGMKYVALFAAGTMSSMLLFFYGPQPLVQGGGEMVAIAENLVRDGAFSDPFITASTGPTAHVAPLYPAFLAALMKVFGTPASQQIGVLLTFFAMGLHASLLAAVSNLAFKDLRPGLYGAALSVILPAFRFMATWEAFWTANGLMLFCLGSHWLRRRTNSLRIAAVLGVFAGLLVLLNPATVLVSLPWIVFLIWRPGIPVRSRLAFLAGSLALAALTCLPWALRNRSTLGALVLKDNFGINLHASNNDCADSSMVPSLMSGCFQRNHPSHNPAEAMLLKQMGEVPYDAYRRATAVRWIRDHPSRFAWLTAKRIVAFWFPVPADPPHAYTVWLITGISFIGIVLLVRRRVPWLWFALSVTAVYPLTYYIVLSDVRYRYPILWISLLCAGYWMAEAAASIRRWVSRYRLHPGRATYQDD
ncbi:MAG: hypothetical protein AAB225_06405 [Acidobacteriota bacterium]